MKRLRLRGFLHGYLLCALLLVGIMLAEALEDQRQSLESEESFEAVPRLIQALVAGLALALAAIPIRILLGLFPEPSGFGTVRLLRRILIGALCGPLPVMTVALLSGNGAAGGEMLGLGMLFGAVVGLGDSLSRDDRDPGRNEDPPEVDV